MCIRDFNAWYKSIEERKKLYGETIVCPKCVKKNYYMYFIKGNPNMGVVCEECNNHYFIKKTLREPPKAITRSVKFKLEPK